VCVVLLVLIMLGTNISLLTYDTFEYQSMVVSSIVPSCSTNWLCSLMLLWPCKLGTQNTQEKVYHVVNCIKNQTYFFDP
jgi:hypothetical protein